MNKLLDKKYKDPEPRFEFGENWQVFLSVLDDEKIKEAENSIKDFLKISSLKGRSFLDAGSGSGLFSLAACRLGADKVFSFDFDPKSVACTHELKKRYLPDFDNWIVEQGSVLDEEYLDGLPLFDVVYSWGVLHHTGSMWRAIENIKKLTRCNGLLYLAIYNDQGRKSVLWEKIKRLYCSNLFGKYLVSICTFPYFLFGGMAVGLLRYNNPFLHFFNYEKNSRGMSLYHDWIDWLGGYPYEVAKPEEIVEKLISDKSQLINHKWTNGSGCNEFLFKRQNA